MRRCKVYLTLTVLLGLGVVGCGGGAASGVALNITPPTASVITNTTQQFSSLVTGSSNTTVTWTLTCATGVAANTCGTIDTNGLYTAPGTIPTATVSGTVTAMPAVTITATAAADTSKVATATVTIITGISLSITPTSATVGTREHFTFIATINNPGCNSIANPNCLMVTWSLPTGTTGVGSIDTNGVYTAPTTAPNPSTVVITATSVTDTTITASATVTIVTANDPTVTSVSPSNAGLGSLFEDFYISGTNFISTSVVFVNGLPIASDDVSSSVIRARLLPSFLVAPNVPPSGILAVTVSQQVGTPQSCPDPAQCQIVVLNVRPAIVGPSPDSVPQTQSSSSVLSFNVNGGFYGTTLNPSVSATYDGQLRGAQVTSNTARQLSISIGGISNSQDFTQAGLHQVTVRSNGDATKFASTNLAVQPDVNANPPTLIGAPLTVGTTPSDVAINPATGMAVIANTGSNDVTLVDLSGASPAVILPSLCTGAIGAAAAPCAIATGPKGVAVAHLINPPRNIALVANTAAKTISEIDLDAKSVVCAPLAVPDPPVAVGINPVTGRALVTINTRPYGVVLDLTSLACPIILGPVSISTGSNSHVAVEPDLNWALATPGNIGSVGIVDLNRQTTNNITNMSRTTNVVTVTVQPSTAVVPQSPLSVEVGDAVLIQGISDNSFNGIYQVTSVGPGSSQFSYTQTGAVLPDVTSFASTGIVNYSQPVATLALPVTVQGVGINTETQTAVFADPSSSGTISFFSLIDQSVSPLALLNSSGGQEPGAAAAAFNSLTDTAYVVNPNNSTLSVIDPNAPRRLPSTSATFATGTTPVAVAVDPASNRLVVVNQGGNSLSVYSLGNSNGVRPIAITQSNPKVFVANSTLITAPAPSAITLTVLGYGFSNNSVARLDGTALTTTFVSNRSLIAIVPPALLSSARQFTLDVLDSGSNLSNAADFTVEQSIDVTGCSAAPLPAGVAIDAQQNIAAVTLQGCNSVALISLSNGTGKTVAVGTSPIGVAVIPLLHLAVVANNGSGNASVVDELAATVTASPTTDSGSQGVATDQDTGEAAIANSVANTVTVTGATTSSTNSISSGQGPTAVAFDYLNHQVAIAATAGNSVGFTDAGASSVTQAVPLSLPTSVIYDPVTGDLGNDCGTASNVVGCFLVNSSTGNSLNIIDPTTQAQTTFRVGINPTAIAYNYLTSTVVSTNTLSHTVTVADFLDRRIRAVLTLPPPPANSSLALTGSLQFAVDIHPLSNLAVIADTANGRVLLLPVPR